MVWYFGITFQDWRKPPVSAHREQLEDIDVLGALSSERRKHIITELAARRISVQAPTVY
jgi:hypothetical protein